MKLQLVDCTRIPLFLFRRFLISVYILICLGSPRFCSCSPPSLVVVLFATKKFRERKKKAEGVEQEERQRTILIIITTIFLLLARKFLASRLPSSFGHVRKPRLRLRVAERMFARCVEASLQEFNKKSKRSRAGNLTDGKKLFSAALRRL